MRKSSARTAAIALAACAALSGLAPLSSAYADGSEALGQPVGITLAQGSGIVTGGVGLVNGPGSINLAVAPTAAVKHVLLYWEGHHIEGTPGDDTIDVAGQSIQGKLIGGPTFYFTSGANRVVVSSYRADITSRNLVKPGANSLPVSGLNFSFSNDGAGIVAIVDDGTDVANIQVRDGLDLAFSRFAPPLNTTVPQTFTVPAAGFQRTAKLNVMVGSVENTAVNRRPNAIAITVGTAPTTVLVNPLTGNSGPEWDSLDLPVVIPAGVTTVKVQLLSQADGSGKLEASLSWVSATLAVRTCPPASNTPANTSGSAYGLDAKLIATPSIINKLGNVSSAAPGGPPNAAAQLLNVGLPDVVQAGIVTTSSTSSLNPSATTSSATVADVSALGGLVRATTVRGVSQSTASTSAASFNSAGSTIQGLKVNNTAVNVAPNTKVIVKNPLGALLPPIAELYIYEDKGTSSFGSGVSQASHSVNMLRIRLLRDYLGLRAGAQIIVGHAESAAQSPTLNCPAAKSVSGEAFTAAISGSLLGVGLPDVKVGEAVLPSTGGSDSDGTAVNVPGIATSATAGNTTSGSLVPSPNATSRSVTQGLSALGGAVTADVLDVRATSSATGAAANTTFNVNLVNLKVGNATVNTNPPPNTLFFVPLTGNGFATVTVNEQVKTGNTTTDTAGTVNAIHIRIFNSGGQFTGEVIVASAHSDAHV